MPVESIISPPARKHKLIAAIIALGLTLGFAVTAVATYNRIIVQRDHTVSGLNEVMEHVTYPLWVAGDLSEGAKLAQVSESRSETTPHHTYLWYTLSDGREFQIGESQTRPHQHAWDDFEVMRRLEIRGQPAVLYSPRYSIGPEGEQVPSTKLILHWHEGQTAVNIVGELTQEDIITIAESMREIGR